MNAETRLKVLNLVLIPVLAESANEVMDAAERIIETRAALLDRRAAAMEQFKRESREVDALMERLQAECTHPATTYSHGMPGEEVTRCDLCGLAL